MPYLNYSETQNQKQLQKAATMKAAINNSATAQGALANMISYEHLGADLVSQTTKQVQVAGEISDHSVDRVLIQDSKE